MKYVIVYWSRYGNGKRIVDYLDEKIKGKSGETQIYKTDEADPMAMPDADLYVFSAPTEAFGIQKNLKKFMKKLQGMDEKKYGIINTHCMNKNVLHKMEKILSDKNMVKVAGVDFLIGKNSKTGDGHITGWELKLDEFIDKL